MSVVADDLLSPKGPVTTVLFPEMELREVQAKLTGFIASAITDARVAAQTDVALKDRMTRLYVLGTTYDEVTQRMIAEPLTLNIGAEKGSHGYSPKQIDMMAGLAAKYWAEFNSLSAPQTVAAANAARIPTLAVPTVTQW